MKVRVKVGAADAYLRSGDNRDQSQGYREEVAQFIREREGQVFDVVPCYEGERLVYELDQNWSFLPRDVEKVDD